MFSSASKQSSVLQKAQRPEDRVECINDYCKFILECLQIITARLLNDQILYRSDAETILQKIRDVTYEVFSSTREAALLKLQREKNLLESELFDLKSTAKRETKSRLYSPEQQQTTSTNLVSSSFKGGRLFETDQKDVIRLKRTNQDQEDLIKQLNTQVETLKDQLHQAEQISQTAQRSILQNQEQVLTVEMELRVSNQERQELKSKNDFFTNAIKNYEQNLKDLRTEYEKQTYQDQENYKKLQSTEKILKEQSEEFQRVQVECEKYKKKREHEQNKQKLALQELKDKSNAKIEKLKVKIKELEQQFFEEKEQVKDREEQIKELEKHILEINEAQKQEIKIAQSSNKKEIESLEIRMAKERQITEENLRKQFQLSTNDKKRLIEEQEAQITSQQSKISNLEQQLNTLLRQSKQQLLSSSDMEYQIQSKERQLEIINQQLTSLQQQCNQKDGKNQILQEDLNQKQVEINDLQYQLEQMDEQLRNIQEENIQLLGINDEQNLQNKKYQEVISRLNSTFKGETRGSFRIELEERIKNLIQERDDLITKVKQLEKDQQTSLQQTTNYLTKSEDLSYQLKQYQDRVINLEKELEYKSKEYRVEQFKVGEATEQLQSENSKLTSQLHETLNQIKQLMDTLSQAEDRVRDQDSELEHLHKEIEYLRSENTKNKDFKENYQALQYRVQGLYKRFKKIMQRNKESWLAQMNEVKLNFQNKINVTQQEVRLLVQKIINIYDQRHKILESERSTLVTQMNIQYDKYSQDLKQSKQTSNSIEIQIRQLSDQLEKKQHHIEQLEDLLATQTRQHEKEMQKYANQLSELSREMYRKQIQQQNREQHRKVDRDSQKSAQKSYENSMRELQRKMEEQMNELKEQYESKIFQLKRSMVDNPINSLTPEHLPQNSDQKYNSSTVNYITNTPNQKYTVPNKPSSLPRPQQSQQFTQSIKVSDNQPERSIEELRQEIQAQKQKLNQIKSSMSEQQQKRDYDQSKYQFNEQSPPIKDPTRYKRELLSTFNQMNV